MLRATARLSSACIAWRGVARRRIARPRAAGRVRYTLWGCAQRWRCKLCRNGGREFACASAHVRAACRCRFVESQLRYLVAQGGRNSYYYLERQNELSKIHIYPSKFGIPGTAWSPV